MDFFSGDCILALRGVLRPYIFTCTIDSRRLASAHPKLGGGPPQKNFNRENLKFAIKFRVLDEITSGLVGVSSRDFFQSTSRRRGDNLGTIFTMPAPKNLWRQKNRPKFCAFLTSFDFDREYLRNGGTYQKSEKLLKIYNHSHVGGKKSFCTSVHKRQSWFP